MTDPIITSFDTNDDGSIDQIVVSYDADNDGITDEVVIDIPAEGGEHIIAHSAGTGPVEVPVVVIGSTGDFVTGEVDERQLDTTGDGDVDQIAVHGHVDNGDGTRTETVTYYAAVENNGSFERTGNALRTETYQWDDTGTPGDARDDQLVSTLFHDPVTGQNTFVTREESVNPANQKTVTLRSYDGEDADGRLTQTTVHTYNTNDQITETVIYTYDANGDVTQIVTQSYDDQGALTKTELSGTGTDPTTVEITHPDINEDDKDDLVIEVKKDNVLQSSAELRDAQRDYDDPTGAQTERAFDGELDDVLIQRFYNANGMLEKSVTSNESDGDGLVDRIVTRTFDTDGTLETAEAVEISRDFGLEYKGYQYDRVVTRTYDGAGANKTLIQRVIEDRYDADNDGTPERIITKTYDADNALLKKVKADYADNGDLEKTDTRIFVRVAEGEGSVLRDRVVDIYDASGKLKRTETYTYLTEADLTEAGEVALSGETRDFGIAQSKVVEIFDADGDVTRKVTTNFNEAGIRQDKTVETLTNEGILAVTDAREYNAAGVLVKKTTVDVVVNDNGEVTDDGFIYGKDIPEHTTTEIYDEITGVVTQIIRVNVIHGDLDKDDNITEATILFSDKNDVLTERHEIVYSDYDANGVAGKIVTEVYSPNFVHLRTQTEIDKNSDGVLDQNKIVFEGSEGSPAGSETHYDDNYDGFVDRIEVNERDSTGAPIARSVLTYRYDHTGDGELNRSRTETYTGDSISGRLMEVAYDDDGDGTADRSETYSYNSDTGLLERVETKVHQDALEDGTTPDPIVTAFEVHEYRDANGNIITDAITDETTTVVTETVQYYDGPNATDGVLIRTEVHTYDADGRITQTAYDDDLSDGLVNRIETYTYDADNSLSETTTGVLIHTESSFDGIDVRSNATPVFADVDGDGDLDLVVGQNSGSLNYYVNSRDGYTRVTGFEDPFASIDVGKRSTPSFADIDGDGDLDLVLGEEEGNLFYYVNDGSGVFAAPTDEENPFDGIDAGDNSRPTFADVDGDGDLDLVVADVTGNVDGILKYYENTGNKTSPVFTEREGSDNPFDGLDVGNRTIPTFVDVNGDGLLDLVVGENEGNLFYYVNEGSADSPVYTEREDSDNPFADINVVSNAAPTFADVDGDGDLDLVVGNQDGELVYFENTGSADSPVYTEASSVITLSVEQSETHIYDDQGRIERTEFDTDADGTVDSVVTREYKDADGKIITDATTAVVTETVQYYDGPNTTDGVLTQTEIHIYDDQGRVTQTTYDDDPSSVENYTYSIETHSYGANEEGNRVETVQYFGTVIVSTVEDRFIVETRLNWEETWTTEGDVRYLTTRTEYVNDDTVLVDVANREFNTVFYDKDGKITQRQDVTAVDANEDNFAETVVRKIYNDVDETTGDGGILIERVEDDLLDRNGDGIADEIKRYTYDGDGVLQSESLRIDDDGDGRHEKYERVTYEEGGRTTVLTRYDYDDNGRADEFIREFFDEGGALLRTVSWSPSENGGPDQNVTETIYKDAALVSQFVINAYYSSEDAAAGLAQSGIRTIYDDGGRPESVTQESYIYDPETRLVRLTHYDENYVTYVENDPNTAPTIDRSTMHAFDRPDVASGALVETVWHYDGEVKLNAAGEIINADDVSFTKIETLTYGTESLRERTEVASSLVEFYEDGLIQRVEHDDNADGTPERVETYIYGVEERGGLLRQIDEDGDGNPDPDRGEYAADRTLLDANGDPVITRTETYEYNDQGQIIKTEINDILDTDGAPDVTVNRIADHEHVKNADGTTTETITYYDAVVGSDGTFTTGDKVSEEIREYDALGQITQSVTTNYVNGTTDRESEETRAYDDQGRIARIERDNGDGDPVQIIYYDDDGDDNPNRQWDYRYNDKKQLERFDYNDYDDGNDPLDGAADRHEEYTYLDSPNIFEDGRLHTTTFYENGTVVEFSSRVYGYDVSGNLVETVSYITGADVTADPDRTETYTYDNKGRLESTAFDDEYDAANPNVDRTEAYTYDNEGNLVSTAFDGAEATDTEAAILADGDVDRTEAYTYDADGRLKSTAFDDDPTANNGVDRTEAYTYDADGRLESTAFDDDPTANNGVDRTETYTYDNKGNLVSTDFDGAEATNTEAAILADGRVDQRKIDTTGDQIADQTLTFEYGTNLSNDDFVRISEEGSNRLLLQGTDTDVVKDGQLDRINFVHTDAFEFRLTESDAQSAKGLDTITLSTSSSSTLVLSEDVYSIIADEDTGHVLQIYGDSNDTVQLTGGWTEDTSDGDDAFQEYVSDDGYMVSVANGVTVDTTVTDDPFAF